MSDLLTGILLGASGGFPLGFVLATQWHNRRMWRRKEAPDWYPGEPLQIRMQARPISKAELEARWKRNGKTPEQEYGQRVLQQYPHGRAKK